MDTPTRRSFMATMGKSFPLLLILKAALHSSGCSRQKSGEQKLMSTSPQELSDELKQRISTDNQNQFNAAIWDRVRFGSYYDEDQELVNIVVYETTDKVINKHEKRYMPEQVWKNLIAGVKVDTLPKDAINPMMDAAQRSRPWDDEGPKAGRPKIRPTLKSARNNPIS